MEQLENAGIMIEANRNDTSLSLERPNSDLRCNWRLSSHNHDTIDLHGTRVAEAVAIVKEILQRDAGCSPCRSLFIYRSLSPPFSGTHPPVPSLPSQTFKNCNRSWNSVREPGRSTQTRCQDRPFRRWMGCDAVGWWIDS